MARYKHYALKYGVPLAMAGARIVGRGISSAVQNKVRSVASKFLTKKRKGKAFRSTRAVTTQRDVRSGSGGARGRKISRAFRAKVRAALQADNPRHLYQAVYKSGGSSTDSIAGFDGVYFLDNNTTAQGDLFNVFKDAYATTAADLDNYKVYLDKAKIDFMIKNTHATNQVEVDLYELVARRDDTQTGTPASLWQTYFADMDAVGTVTYDHPGLTPYDVPNFIRSWRVVKTTKFLIDPGKSISTSMSAALNKVMSGMKLSQSNTILRGVTRAYLFRVRGAPENATATGTRPASGLGAWSVAWSALTNIHYQSMPTSDQTEDVDQSK